MSAAEWRELAAEARALAHTDTRNAKFHAESARMFERAATRKDPS